MNGKNAGPVGDPALTDAANVPVIVAHLGDSDAVMHVRRARAALRCVPLDDGHRDPLTNSIPVPHRIACYGCSALDWQQREAVARSGRGCLCFEALAS